MKNNIRKIAFENKGWSLYKLAKRLGAEQQTVYSWARGRTMPKLENLEKLVVLLETSLDDLFTVETKCSRCKKIIPYKDSKIYKNSLNCDYCYKIKLERG